MAAARLLDSIAMPADEDLRIEAARRIDRARHLDPSTGPIAAISLYGLAWLLTAPAAVAIALWAGPPSGWHDAATWGAICGGGLPAALAAGAAAWVAVRRRAVLSGFWLAAAFLPWAVTALAAGFVVVAVSM